MNLLGSPGTAFSKIDLVSGIVVQGFLGSFEAIFDRMYSNFIALRFVIPVVFTERFDSLVIQEFWRADSLFPTED